MTKDDEAFLNALKLVGMCLLCVQQAEQALVAAVDTVFDHPDFRLMEQTEYERKQTLGVFLKKLKRRVRVEPKLKDKLYRFLEMRNKFVHNVGEIDGWNLKTKEGRNAAVDFLAELITASLGISALIATLFRVALKEDFGEDPAEGETEDQQQAGNILEKHLGSMARKMLASRNRRQLLQTVR